MVHTLGHVSRVTPGLCTLPITVALLSGLGPHTGAVFQHLTSHCAVTELCQLQHHLHVTRGTSEVEMMPLVSVAAVLPSWCHEVWLDHIDGVSGALRKQSPTTMSTIRHVPRCKICPITSQTSTEQTVLQVHWGILGGQRWLPPLLYLQRESGSQHRLSCLPRLGFPPLGHYFVCSGAKLLHKLTVRATGRSGIQRKIENTAWRHGHTGRDLGSHLKMQFVVYKQILVATGMCFSDCWKSIAEEGTQSPSPKPHANAEASPLSIPFLGSRV